MQGNRHSESACFMYGIQKIVLNIFESQRTYPNIGIYTAIGSIGKMLKCATLFSPGGKKCLLEMMSILVLPVPQALLVMQMSSLSPTPLICRLQDGAHTPHGSPQAKNSNRM